MYKLGATRGHNRTSAADCDVPELFVTGASGYSGAVPQTAARTPTGTNLLTGHGNFFLVGLQVVSLLMSRRVL